MSDIGSPHPFPLSLGERGNVVRETGVRPFPEGLIREDVRALHAYAVAPADGLVKLDLMENPYVLPPDLARALGERLGQVALNCYPPGEPARFKERLAERIGLPAGQALLLGNGSDEIIHLMIHACARPGAAVLSPWPSFSMYRMTAEVDRCRFVGVDLRDDFGLDLPAMLAALREHRPALVFLSYPNNPTGNCFDDDAVRAIIEHAPGLVVLDEAYLPFAGRSWIGELPRHPNLLVLRTFSKLGLAGLRLGYLCGAPEWLGEFDKLRPPFNVDSLTLAAADFLLDHLDVFDAQAATIRADRARMIAALRTIDGLEVFDSAANFVLLRVPDGDRGAGARFAHLLRQGILVKNMTAFHPMLRGCLRVTVGTPEENAAFLDAMRQAISPLPQAGAD